MYVEREEERLEGKLATESLIHAVSEEERNAGLSTGSAGRRTGRWERKAS
jgi:hypothetical protein